MFFLYIYIYLENSTFLDLGSIANIDQHEVIFPTVYNMMGFRKNKFFIKFGPLPQQPAPAPPKKIVDIFFLRI